MNSFRKFWLMRVDYGYVFRISLNHAISRRKSRFKIKVNPYELLVVKETEKIKFKALFSDEKRSSSTLTTGMAHFWTTYSLKSWEIRLIVFFWHLKFNHFNWFSKISNLFLLLLNFYKMCDDIILRPGVSYRIFWTTPQAT